MSNRVNCRKFYLLYFFKELLASLRTDVPLPYLAFQSDENSFYWNNRSCERTHSTFSVLDTALHIREIGFCYLRDSPLLRIGCANHVLYSLL